MRCGWAFRSTARTPKFFPLGTKTGCRRLFAEAGVAHPIGREDLWSIEAVAEALAGLRKTKPSIAKAMVKLNEAVSGEGNAVVDLEGLPAPGARSVRGQRLRVQEMRFELSNVALESYGAKLEERGAIVEERIVGEEIRSPSVQLRVTPLGDVEVLSTHDQLLGGPSSQLYLGCRFPADPAYAALIAGEARKLGARLAREGVLGRFAVYFVVVRAADRLWVPYAIELNLRKGGTTHPFLTLQFLTDGSYDEERGVFVAPSGQEKCFVATDHLTSALYRAFTPDDLFDIAIRYGLHFDQTRQVGIVFHMLATLAENGRIGATAVGNSPADADRLLERLQSALEDETQRALEPRELPEATISAAAGLGDRTADQTPM